MKTLILRSALKALCAALVASIVACLYLAVSMSHVYVVYTFGTAPVEQVAMLDKMPATEINHALVTLAQNSHKKVGVK